MLKITKITPDKKLQTNNYLFKFQNKNILIDAGLVNTEELLEKISELGGELDLILLTHGHYDHIAGLELLIDKFPQVQCYIHEQEMIFLKNTSYNYSRYYSVKFELNDKYLGNIKTYKDGENINGIEIIHTPGHTIGSSCFYIPTENICFSGDTLFANGYGRYDLQTGNMFELQRSLDKIYKLPPETIIYSGHGPKGVLGKMGIYY